MNNNYIHLINDLKKLKEQLVEIIDHQYSSDSWNELTSAERTTLLSIDRILSDYEVVVKDISKLS